MPALVQISAHARPRIMTFHNLSLRESKPQANSGDIAEIEFELFSALFLHLHPGSRSRPVQKV
jgi:hypothetical protein